MKIQFYILGLSCILLLCFTQNSFAVNSVPGKDATIEKEVSGPDFNNNTNTKAVSKKDLRKQKRLERKVEKLNKRLSKKGSDITIDLRDPTEKWFWFWILGWSLGILLTIVASIMGIFSGLMLLSASLLFIAGTVCLILWLVRKFA